MSFVLLIFFGGALGASPRIQEISDLTSEVSLDSSETDTWWISTGNIDPQSEWNKLSEVSSAGPDVPAGQWEETVIPNRARESSKVVWLRKTFFLGSRAENVALRLGVITDSDRTYVNGRLIAQSGQWDSDLPQAYDKLRLYRVPEGVLKPGPNLILIECKSYFADEVGIQKDRTSIGPADRLFKEFYIYNFREAGLLVLYFTAGSYFLFLFLRRRRERENLLFGLFTWDLVIYQFLRTQFKNVLEWDFLFWKKAEYVSLFLLIPLFYYFVRTYFDLPKRKLLRVWDIAAGGLALAQTALCGVAVFSNDVRMLNQLNVTLVQPMWLVLILGILSIVVYRIVCKDRDALYMVFGLVFVLAAAGMDVLSSRSIINTPRLTGYAFIFFIMSLALILANRFVRLNEQVEDLNKNLEMKVSERTLELNTTLSEVRALKVQQDGDYFLTSLLLKPLNGIHAVSETVSASMIMEQKKQFHFKKWTAEIGGDVVSTYSISLRGRPYTAVINADAMGKSIQGAGGALVLGTVFKNVVARTQDGQLLADRFPEQWMKECFIELQNVFVSFDGSMMVSAVLGVIDDLSGLLYYINAEHPYTVIYREGRAAFIEKDADYLRKIGIQGLDSALRVGTLQLLPADIVIMGSDGRDDIAIGTDESGHRIINEDTDVFLSAVEQSHGDLDALVANIKSRGEITDDLSLLRIAFHGQAVQRANAVNLVAAARSAAEKKDFAHAAKLLGEAHELEPGNHVILFELAAALRHLAQTRKDAMLAADIAERVRLRQPHNVENLVLLADLNRLTGNTQRSIQYISRAEALDPSNPALPRLKGLLRTV